MAGGFWMLFGFLIWCAFSRWVFGRRMLPVWIVLLLSVNVHGQALQQITPEYAELQVHYSGYLNGSIEIGSGVAYGWCTDYRWGFVIDGRGSIMITRVTLIDYGDYYAGSAQVGRKWTIWPPGGESGQLYRLPLATSTCRVFWEKGSDYVTVLHDDTGSATLYRQTLPGHTPSRPTFCYDQPESPSAVYHSGLINVTGPPTATPTAGLGVRLVTNWEGDVHSDATTQPSTQPTTAPTTQPVLDKHWATSLVEGLVGADDGMLAWDQINDALIQAEEFGDFELFQQRTQIDASGGGLLQEGASFGESGTAWIQAAADWQVLTNWLFPNLDYELETSDPGYSIFDGDVRNIRLPVFKAWQDGTDSYGEPLRMVRVMVNFGICILAVFTSLRLFAWGLGWRNPQNAAPPNLDPGAMASPAGLDD